MFVLHIIHVTGVKSSFQNFPNSKKEQRRTSMNLPISSETYVIKRKKVYAAAERTKQMVLHGFVEKIVNGENGKKR